MGGRDSRNRDLVELHRQADGVDARSRRHRNAVPSVLTQQPDRLSPCQRPSKAAQVWPSKIAHLAEVTSL